MRKKNSQFDILLNTPIMFFTKNKMKDGIFMWNAIFEALYYLCSMMVCCKDSKRRGTFWVESLASVFSQEDFWIALCNANYHIFCKKVHFLNSSKHEKAFVRSLFKLSQWESTVWTEGFFSKVALPQLKISPSKMYFFFSMSN